MDMKKTGVLAILAAGFAFLILKELVTVMQISGIVLLVVGVFLLSRKEEAYF